MPFPVTAQHRILERMKEIAVAADLFAAWGVGGTLKIRHERHRKTTVAERPGAALRLVNIEIDENRGGIHSQSEICWAMTVEIVVDIEIPPEGNVSDDDPTGWNRASAIGGALANLFISEASALRDMVDDIVPADVDPDEDSKTEDVRLAQSVVVLYRTLWNDLNHLLTAEENGL